MSKSFGDLPQDTGRKYLLNRLHISKYLIDKCVEKVRNKKPIIVDFFSHGSYKPNDSRDSIPGFLLTMAKTGSSTAARDVSRVFRRYSNNIEQLLYGDLNTIYKRVDVLDKKAKMDKVRGLFAFDNSFKLYNGLGVPHYNQKGEKVRSANVEKKAPPIYASFSDTGTSFNKGNFFIEPDGIYLLEDSAHIWGTYKKADLFKTFDKREWGGLLRLEDLEQLHKLYGINNDKEYYNHDGDEKKITKLNRELMKYHDIRSSPLFAYKMKKSFFIPKREGKYRVAPLIDGITKLIKTELLNHGVTETPVILFTFLQCKSIRETKLRDKELKKSNALNLKIKRQIGRVYKNYVSPVTLPMEGAESLALQKSLKKVNKQYQIQKKKVANKTRKMKRDLCKGLVEIQCENIPECVFIEAGKIKKCVAKANVKGKTRKKSRAKPVAAECKGLAEADCKPPKCMYTRGKRKYCRKAGKKTMAKPKAKAKATAKTKAKAKTKTKAKVSSINSAFKHKSSSQQNPSQVQTPSGSSPFAVGLNPAQQVPKAKAKAKVAHCKGLSKTECKEPHCKYTEGKKRQFCRKAKNERK